MRVAIEVFHLRKILDIYWDRNFLLRKVSECDAKKRDGY